jgi:TIR domain
MAKIIVSYRRSDSDAIAGRIRDRLSECYGNAAVFMDIDSIPFGKDFRAHVREAVLKEDIVLAIIGPKWTGRTKAGVSRINEETDPVRIELEIALERGIPVIPVLVGGASMPKADALPATLKDLPFLNAAVIDAGRDFHQHVDRLIRSTDSLLNIKSAELVPTAIVKSRESGPVISDLGAPAIDTPALVPDDNRYKSGLLVRGLPTFSDRAEESKFKEFFSRQTVGQARVTMAIGAASWTFLGVTQGSEPLYLSIEFHSWIAIPSFFVVFASSYSKLALRFWQPFLLAISIIDSLTVFGAAIVSYRTGPPFNFESWIVVSILTGVFGCLLPLRFANALLVYGFGFVLFCAFAYVTRPSIPMIAFALNAIVTSWVLSICVAYNREKAFRLLFRSLND